ncbi:MAG: tetraacyldisaccharide 4'-kinase [Flavobacteriales bacterium]|nr:tetraacyldisaccharide 4'-kinase [Flavobacteriales bacterium]
MKKLRRLLFPFSFIYALVIYLRNKLFDAGILTSTPGSLPTLVVGNVHVGGTGKTPHTRFFLSQLSDLNPAVLSRGYGRSSKGFIEVHLSMPVEKTGDEIRLYKRSHPRVKAVVCEDRLTGVQQIKESGHEGIVILDDAMQHRKLMPDALVALVRADSLQELDMYLPAGDLRDGKYRLRKADAVIISGWNPAMDDVVKESELRALLRLDASTPLFKSQIAYGTLFPLQHDSVQQRHEIKRIILVTGIAHPEALHSQISKEHTVVDHFHYRDHASFDTSDLESWRTALANHNADAIITTEKDLVRMEGLSSVDTLPIWYQPMTVEIDKAETLTTLLRKKLNRP